MQKIIRPLHVFLIFSLLCVPAFAQPGHLDTTFAINYYQNNSISQKRIIVQPNGKVLVAGDTHTASCGGPRNYITRFNADGSVDNSFTAGNIINAQIYAMALQSDGKIVVGGVFSEFIAPYSPVNYLTRLNSDGSPDPAFATGTGLNLYVFDLAIQSDGKIVAVGFFTEHNGNVSRRIIRLNTNGTPDGTFNTGTGFNDDVYSVQIQSDNKILLGGIFTQYNGIYCNRIARLNSDGSFDNSFNTGSGFNFTNGLSSAMLKLQPDNKIVVFGAFDQYNGTAVSNFVRLNTNGSLDNTLVTGQGFNNLVNAVNIQPDGKIVAVGSFTNYNGAVRNRIARLNANGSIDNTFNSNGAGFNEVITSLDIQTDKKIVVAGRFNDYSGKIVTKIARVHGELDVTGLKENSIFEGVKLFPNPTTGKFLLQSESLPGKISVHDISGKEIVSSEPAANTVEFDLSAYENGIYFVTLISGNQSKTFKLVKN